VQALAGHSSLAMTQLYIEQNSDAQKKLIDMGRLDFYLMACNTFSEVGGGVTILDTSLPSQALHLNLPARSARK
jgi:hypothetical protein